MPRKLPWVVDAVRDDKQSESKSSVELPRQGRSNADDLNDKGDILDDTRQRVDFLRSCMVTAILNCIRRDVGLIVYTIMCSENSSNIPSTRAAN
jgi:hypothetical protein